MYSELYLKRQLKIFLNIPGASNFPVIIFSFARNRDSFVSRKCCTGLLRRMSFPVGNSGGQLPWYEGYLNCISEADRNVSRLYNRQAGLVYIRYVLYIYAHIYIHPYFIYTFKFSLHEIITITVSTTLCSHSRLSYPPIGTYFSRLVCGSRDKYFALYNCRGISTLQKWNLHLNSWVRGTAMHTLSL